MRLIFAATIAATFLGLFPDLAKANTNALVTQSGPRA